jgi:hypothetical protein
MSTGVKLLIVAISIIFIEWVFEDDSYHTSTFCAYGKVFVKFKDGNNVWGTIMLDQDGLPIKCKIDKSNTNRAVDLSGTI